MLPRDKNTINKQELIEKARKTLLLLDAVDHEIASLLHAQRELSEKENKMALVRQEVNDSDKSYNDDYLIEHAKSQSELLIKKDDVEAALEEKRKERNELLRQMADIKNLQREAEIGDEERQEQIRENANLREEEDRKAEEYRQTLRRKREEDERIAAERHLDEQSNIQQRELEEASRLAEAFQVRLQKTEEEKQEDENSRKDVQSYLENVSQKNIIPLASNPIENDQLDEESRKEAKSHKQETDEEANRNAEETRLQRVAAQDKANKEDEESRKARALHLEQTRKADEESAAKRHKVKVTENEERRKKFVKALKITGIVFGAIVLTAGIAAAMVFGGGFPLVGAIMIAMFVVVGAGVVGEYIRQGVLSLQNKKSPQDPPAGSPPQTDPKRVLLTEKKQTASVQQPVEEVAEKTSTKPTPRTTHGFFSCFKGISSSSAQNKQSVEKQESVKNKR